MIRLTKAEEDIMKILWELQEGTILDILQKLSIPKPAYNTVSTIVRILEDKKIVAYRKAGRFHMYYPIITKSVYSNQSINNLLEGYFKGSFKSMMSFFIKQNAIDIAEMEATLSEINKDLKNK